MTNDQLSFRAQVLLSMQRALWEMVTPELRGVTTEIREPHVRARFLYDAAPTAEELGIVAETESYVLADFNPDVDIKFIAEHVPAPRSRDLKPGEEWVYLRREPSPVRSR